MRDSQDTLYLEPLQASYLDLPPTMRGSSSMDVTDAMEDPTAWGVRREEFNRSPPVVSSGTTGLDRFRSVSAHNTRNRPVLID